MTSGFTDAEHQDWLAIRRGRLAGDGRGVLGEAMQPWRQCTGFERGMVTDSFALCAVCDDD